MRNEVVLRMLLAEILVFCGLIPLFFCDLSLHSNIHINIHEFKTKFGTLRHLAIGILIKEVFPLDFFAFLGDFHSFLLFSLKLMNIQVSYFPYLTIR